MLECQYMIVSIVCQIFVIVRRRGAFKWKFNLWVRIQLLYDGIPAYWYTEEVVTVTQAQRYRKNYSLIVNIDSACRKRLKEGSIRINIYLDRLSKCNNISRLTGGAAHTGGRRCLMTCNHYHQIRSCITTFNSIIIIIIIINMGLSPIFNVCLKKTHITITIWQISSQHRKK